MGLVFGGLDAVVQALDLEEFVAQVFAQFFQGEVVAVLQGLLVEFVLFCGSSELLLSIRPCLHQLHLPFLLQHPIIRPQTPHLLLQQLPLPVPHPPHLLHLRVPRLQLLPQLPYLHLIYFVVAVLRAFQVLDLLVGGLLELGF